MATGYPGYVYRQHMLPTAITTAITLIQVAAGTASSAEILEICLGQTTKTSASELWELALVRKTAAATVTAGTTGTTSAATLTQQGLDDPAPAAATLTVSTTGTGQLATAEGTDGNYEDGPWVWNILNGMFIMTYNVDELRPQLRASDISALKLFTTPAASTTVMGYIKIGVRR